LSALTSITLSLPASPYPPLVVGFMGLGTGYFIYGAQELIGYPKRGGTVDLATGIWGLWMPGFMQFVAGLYLFAGLTLFGTFTSQPPLYMAAFAFTTYGIHWFALGWNRMRTTDTRVQLGMSFTFLLISILGAIVFFGASDWPTALIFIGLCGVYISEFFASLKPDFVGIGAMGEKALGFFHLLTACWLMYMMFAVTLDITLGYTLPK
jgi:hypothetical protein